MNVPAAPEIRPSLPGRVYGMRCGGAMTMVPHEGAVWFVCPDPCRRHWVKVEELEAVVRAEVAARIPGCIDLDVEALAAAVARHVTHVYVTTTDARDAVVHLAPARGAE